MLDTHYNNSKICYFFIMKVVYKKHKRLIFSAILILLIASSFAYQSIQNRVRSNEHTSVTLTDPDSSHHKVTLTKDGFEPEELVILKGDTVSFVTFLDSPFWPASDFHPSHTIYPEFDSLEYISPDKTWEFVFNKEGRWKFHDHTNASYDGAIIVLTSDEVKSGKITDEVWRNVANCKEFADEAMKNQCWEYRLENVLKSQGVAAAFEFFIELYREEPNEPKGCHQWAHILGDAAYRDFKKDKELYIRPEASYCGFGYFHSLITEHMRETGDIYSATVFCEVIVKELEGEVPNIYGGCVHGVGHGATAWLIEQPANWGNLLKTANEGIVICELLYSETKDQENCYFGVFNELQLDLQDSKYGFSYEEYLEKDDPLFYCNQLDRNIYKGICYAEFAALFIDIFDNDIVAGMRYMIENAEDLEETGYHAVRKLAADQITYNIAEDPQEKTIEVCRVVPEYLKQRCIFGIANGYYFHGEPNNVHIKGFEFCRANFLTAEERKMCFTEFNGFLYNNYSEEQFINTCKLLDERDRHGHCSQV